MTTSSKIFYGTLGAAFAAFIGYIVYKKTKSSSLSTNEVLSELFTGKATTDTTNNTGNVNGNEINTGNTNGDIVNAGNVNGNTNGDIHDVFTTTPKSSFTFSPINGNFPLKVMFKNESKNATSYLWDFGDGTTSKYINPTHIYSKEGTFLVKLNSLNSKKDNDTYSSSIKVSKATIVTQTPTPLPKASFTFTPTSGTPPLTVNFTNSSTGATSYSWDFGDGTTSKDLNPTKIFSKAGSFNVKLSAISSSGSNYLTKSVVVNAGSNSETPNKGSNPTSTSPSSTSPNSTNPEDTTPKEDNTPKRTVDKNGNYIEKDDPTTLYDKNGKVIGDLDSDGFFKDKNGKPIATSEGVAITGVDQYGNYTEKDGSVYAPDGTPITLSPDGSGNYIEEGHPETLYDKDGHEIGNLDSESGNYKDANGNVIASSDGTPCTDNGDGTYTEVGGATYTNDGTEIEKSPDGSGNYVEKGSNELRNVDGDVIGKLNPETGNYENENGDVIAAGDGSSVTDNGDGTYTEADGTIYTNEGVEVKDVQPDGSYTDANGKEYDSSGQPIEPEQPTNEPTGIEKENVDSEGNHIEKGDPTTLYDKDGNPIADLDPESGLFLDSDGNAIATSEGVAISDVDAFGNYTEAETGITCAPDGTEITLSPDGSGNYVEDGSNELRNAEGEVIGTLNSETGNYENENGDIVAAVDGTPVVDNGDGTYTEVGGATYTNEGLGVTDIQPDGSYTDVNGKEYDSTGNPIENNTENVITTDINDEPIDNSGDGGGVNGSRNPYYEHDGNINEYQSAGKITKWQSGKIDNMFKNSSSSIKKNGWI